MTRGTKSLLFGVHQVFWHPATVLIAWIRLYGGLPSWRELICIIVHDWGYWGSPNMDGEEGRIHPERGARIAVFLGEDYRHLCLFHSRNYAQLHKAEPSGLCWADKMSIIYDPWLFYLFRAHLSGELREYRQIAADAGFVPLFASNREWFKWMREHFRTQVQEKRREVVPSCLNHAEEVTAWVQQ